MNEVSILRNLLRLYIHKAVKLCDHTVDTFQDKYEAISFFFLHRTTFYKEHKVDAQDRKMNDRFSLTGQGKRKRAEMIFTQ